jgi:hypothetical protein
MGNFSPTFSKIFNSLQSTRKLRAANPSERSREIKKPRVNLQRLREGRLKEKLMKADIALLLKKAVKFYIFSLINTS